MLAGVTIFALLITHEEIQLNRVCYFHVLGVFCGTVIYFRLFQDLTLCIDRPLKFYFRQPIPDGKHFDPVNYMILFFLYYYLSDHPAQTGKLFEILLFLYCRVGIFLISIQPAATKNLLFLEPACCLE